MIELGLCPLGYVEQHFHFTGSIPDVHDSDKTQTLDNDSETQALEGLHSAQDEDPAT